MAHRFNCEAGRVQPKPSASERTWYRYRIRRGIGHKKDVERQSSFIETKEKIKETFVGKLRKNKSDPPK